MTSEEAKQALLNKCPVVFNGLEFAHLSAILYRVGENNNIVVSAELYSNCGHSLTYAPINQIQILGVENGENN